MDEATIRMAAKLYSIVAEMEEIKANIEAMKADNVEQESRGEALAWSYLDFQEASKSLSRISWRLDNEI